MSGLWQRPPQAVLCCAFSFCQLHKWWIITHLFFSLYYFACLSLSRWGSSSPPPALRPAADLRSEERDVDNIPAAVFFFFSTSSPAPPPPPTLVRVLVLSCRLLFLRLQEPWEVISSAPRSSGSCSQNNVVFIWAKIAASAWKNPSQDKQK